MDREPSREALMFRRAPTLAVAQAATPALFLSALAVAACSGSIGPGQSGEPGSGSNPGSTPPGSTTNPIPEPPRAASCKLDLGRSPLRLLTKTEYLNTVRDVFGAPRDVGGDLPDDGRP